MSHEEQLRTLGLYSLDKRGQLHCFLGRGSGEESTQLFSRGTKDRNNSKIHLRSFRLGIRKLLFTERVVKPCNGFLERSMPWVCWCLYNTLDKMLELLGNPESVRKLD